MAKPQEAKLLRELINLRNQYKLTEQEVIDLEDKILNKKIASKKALQEEYDLIIKLAAEERKRDRERETGGVKYKQLNKEISEQLKQQSPALNNINQLFGNRLPILKNIQGEASKYLIQQSKQNKGLYLQNKSQMKSFVQQGKFTALLKGTGAALRAQILNPAFLIAEALNYNTQLTELQKGLGLSYQEAQKLKFELDGIAINLGNNAILSKDITQAFQALNKQLGVSVNDVSAFEDGLAQAAVLQKLYGFTADQAARFTREVVRTGKAAEDLKLDQIEIVKNVGNEFGVRLDIKNVMQQAASVTGQMRAQLGGSLENIVEAVSAAQSLGLQLSQVEKISSSLLNFEQSIEAELRAELITGEQLNLEKARLYALTGDYTNLVKEINAQGMDWNKWSGMNVLQQKEYAAALGLSANELSDALLKEEDIAALAQEARMAGKDELADMLEKRSAQQKFTDAVEKLKDVFVSLAGPVSIILEALTIILTPISEMIQGLGAIKELIMGNTEGFGEMAKKVGPIGMILGSMVASLMAFKTTMLVINTAKGIYLGMTKSALVLERASTLIQGRGVALAVGKMVARYIAAFSTNPITAVLGTVAALAVAAKVYSLASKKAGDLRSGPTGPSGGYGERTLIAPEGTFALSNRDTVIAGTNLFQGGGNYKANDLVSEGGAQPTTNIMVSNDLVVDDYKSASKQGAYHKAKVKYTNKIP